MRIIYARLLMLKTVLNNGETGGAVTASDVVIDRTMDTHSCRRFGDTGGRSVNIMFLKVDL